MNKYNAPARSNDVTLHQLLKLIPRGMLGRVARETGIDAKARSFSVPSHLSAMPFAQLTHAIGLNDVCDWLRMKAHVLARHGLSAPSRNGLSHANKQRDAAFIEKLFWEQLARLQHDNPSFAGGMRAAAPFSGKPGGLEIGWQLRKSAGFRRNPWFCGADDPFPFQFWIVTEVHQQPQFVSSGVEVIQDLGTVYGWFHGFFSVG